MLIGNHVEEILQRDSFESIVDYLKLDLPELVLSETDDVCLRALNMDIKQQLNLYEVEYQLLNEEMIDMRQSKEKYDKQEQLLQDTRKQLATIQNEFKRTKNTVNNLQYSLHEANRRNCQYEKQIQMLLHENKQLKQQNKQNNTTRDVITAYSDNTSVHSNDSKDTDLDTEEISMTNQKNISPSSPTVEGEMMFRGMSLDSALSMMGSDDSMDVSATNEP